MKIKMNRPARIYVDGIKPSDFETGQIVDLPAAIAIALLEDGRASEVKAEGPAPENKMEGPAPKNKERRGKRHGH